MPYISSRQRDKFRKALEALPSIDTSGELAYLLTKLCNKRRTSTRLSFENLNAIVGTLETTKQEFIRRQLVPYEEDKIAENGDLENDEKLD